MPHMSVPGNVNKNSRKLKMYRCITSGFIFDQKVQCFVWGLPTRETISGRIRDIKRGRGGLMQLYAVVIKTT